jgi:Ankyrin repeat
MHVLHPERFKDTREYLELLQLLSEHHFPFSQRDYHGQTVADLFFASAEPKMMPVGEWNVIFSQLEAGIQDWKTFFVLCKELATHTGYDQEGQSKWEKRFGSLLALGRKPTSFKRIRQSSLTDLALISKSLDINRDSALICIVKEWRPIEDERQLARMIGSLIRRGAEVHLRDRHGDTALAIAARRGLRPAVIALLDHGANPNTRNYQGRGILSQTMQHLRPAKHGKKALQYARILSCIALLTDHGAKEEPTTYDEFMSPTALTKTHLPLEAILVFWF